MRLMGWWLLGMSLLLFPCAVFCDMEKVSRAEASDWVRPVDVDPVVEDQDHHSQDGMFYVLHESQRNWDADEQFLRNISLLQNDSGVQNAGKLVASFNPAHQELIFHKVGVFRDGQYIDKLNLSEVQLIQPEAELEIDTISGVKQAVLFIADLRVGDLLEYSYTVRGKNPVLKDFYVSAFYTQWSIPIDRQHVRILCREDQSPKIRRVKTDLVPRIGEMNGLREYIWDIRNPETITYEDMTPYGFDIFPYIELSSCDDWAEVVDWALPLYQPEADELPAGLQAKIAQWQLSAGTEEERLVEVIRFIQDEIRYTGIQLGAQAYQPAHPFETFRLRYGDCKGKSVLLCIILKELGIEAYPALVDSETRRVVAERLPSPVCFDHVIVKIIYQNRPIWIDVTRSLQGGGLETRYVPNFGKALVLKNGVSELEDMPDLDGDAKISTYTTIRIKDYESPVQMEIKTINEGANADHLRFQIANQGQTDLDRSYLNFTALFYPSAQMKGSLITTDDRVRNTMTVEESYTVDSFWEWDEDERYWFGVITAELMDSYLPNPEVRARKMPIGLGHPVHRKQQVTIHLPDDEWDVPEESNTVEGPGFKLDYHQKLTGRRLVYTYTCATTAREVAAADVPEFFEMSDELQDAIVRVLYHYENTEQQGLDINWMMVVIALFGVGATVGVCRRIWKMKGEIRKEDGANRWSGGPSPGISGFLILVAIGLCLSPLVRFISFFELKSAFSLQVWQILTVPGSEQYEPFYAPLVILEILGNILLFGIDFLLLALFFAKRRLFPVVFIVARIGSVVFVAADTWLAGWIFGAMEFDPQLVGATFWTIVFSVYMLQSQRVKVTFRR